MLISKQESLYATLRSQMLSAEDSKTAIQESLALYKSRGEQIEEIGRDT